MKHPRIYLAAVCIVGTCLAWHLRFVQDDAFISFAYARNLVQGDGLTWFGSRIEGYTNFLWVLWIALGIRIGANAVDWSYLGGIISYLITILCMWKLSYLILKDYLPGLVAIALFSTNYTTLSYATGGLETMLQTALLCAMACQVWTLRNTINVGHSRIAGLSLLFAAAVLTRMDSALPVAILGLITIGHLHRRRSSWRPYLALAAPFAILVGAWLIWKQGYYGTVLPNSYHAKIDGRFNPNGLVYLGRFLHWYVLWPFLVIGGVVALLKRTIPPFGMWSLVVIVLSWCVYIVYVGADFMEFRFMVPVAPFLFLMLGYLLHYCPMGSRTSVHRAMTIGSVLIIAAASFHHAVTFKGTTKDMALDSVDALATFYGVYPQRDWGKIGRTLRHQLGETDVVIATHAVGAIPFYSGLTTIDMWGLNDRGVIERGKRIDRLFRRPGHRVHATVSYLRERQVNLVIGHPTFVQHGMLGDVRNHGLLRGVVNNMVFMNDQPIGEPTVVSMPVDPEFGLVMWYLTPHPRVEQLIRRGEWQAAKLTDVTRRGQPGTSAGP